MGSFYYVLALRIVWNACDVFNAKLGTKLLELTPVYPGLLSVLITCGFPMVAMHCKVWVITSLDASPERGDA